MAAVDGTAPLSVRSNGWTMERRRRFLASLAAGRTVSRACAEVGLSREAAYKARRRDPAFARNWGRAQQAAATAARETFLDSLPDVLRARLAARRDLP